jgi:hypothetical protein
VTIKAWFIGQNCGRARCQGGNSDTASDVTHRSLPKVPAKGGPWRSSRIRALVDASTGAPGRGALQSLTRPAHERNRMIIHQVVFAKLAHRLRSHPCATSCRPHGCGQRAPGRTGRSRQNVGANDAFSADYCRLRPTTKTGHRGPTSSRQVRLPPDGLSAPTILRHPASSTQATPGGDT